MVTPQPRRHAVTARATRPFRAATALSAVVAGAVVGSALLPSASADVVAPEDAQEFAQVPADVVAGVAADVVALPAGALPVSEPQVVLVQRVERPVVIRREGRSRLSAKGNDLVEISALGS